MKRFDQYIAGVTSGKIPCGLLVRQAVERHLRDMDTAAERGLYFDEAAGQRALDFFGHLRHSKGKWAKKPFDLAPWQAFIIASIFGWKKANGLRRFRVAYIELPRKNGKSTLAAGIALYCLTADGEQGAEVYCAATKRDQAKIVHEEARRMVKSSPALAKHVTTLRNNLHVPKTNSKCEPLGADADTMDGLNPSAVIIDELHAHKTRQVWDVLDTATDARSQPILICITTAGADKVSVCGEQHDHGEKVVAGIVEDDSTFVFIAAMDEGDDWKKETSWAKANPNFNISIFPEGLRSKFAKAQASSPAALHALLRLHLGVWSKGEKGLFDMERWDACAGESTADPWEELAGRDCFCGLDLAKRFDITAFVMLFPPRDQGEPWKVLCRFWVPRENAEKRSRMDRVPYLTWIDQGHITPTQGDVIDFDNIRHDLQELRDRYNIRAVGFDPWNAQQLATQLAEQDGLYMEEVYQGYKNLNEPTKELLKKLAGGEICHFGNPVLSWMASNTVADEDKSSGALKPSRQNSREKIDGIAALVMAMGQAITDSGASVYDQEDRGLLSF